jgi:hypothetical protein
MQKNTTVFTPSELHNLCCDLAKPMWGLKSISIHAYEYAEVQSHLEEVAHHAI